MESLKIESTDAGDSGPELLLQHSPGEGNMADNDVVSLLQFAGVDNSNTGCNFSFKKCNKKKFPTRIFIYCRLYSVSC